MTATNSLPSLHQLQSVATVRVPDLPLASRNTWAVNAEGVLSPTAEYIAKLNSFLFSRKTDDLLFRFVFAPYYDAEPLLVHHSRLAWAGGELYEWLKREIKSGGIGEVCLRDCDDPETFAVIREYLYGIPVVFQQCSLWFLARVGRAASDWQLQDLLVGVCDYIINKDLLKNKWHVLAVLELAPLPGLPEPFRGYFWGKIGLCVSLDEEAKKEEDVKVEPFQSVPKPIPIERKFCAQFPDLWDVAMSQGMVKTAIQSIMEHSNEQMKLHLLEVIFLYIEPRIENDDSVCDLFNLLGLQSVQTHWISEEHRKQGKYSVRGLGLLSKCLTKLHAAEQKKQISWKCSWSKNLQAFGNGEEFIKTVFLSYKNPDLMIRDGCLTEYDVLMHNSINFKLRKSRNSGKNVVLRLGWKTGKFFLDNGKKRKIEVKLEVLEDNCTCERRLWNHNMGRRLGVANFTNELDIYGTVEMMIERNVVLKRRSAHVDPGECMLSLSLEVAVDNGEEDIA